MTRRNLSMSVVHFTRSSLCMCFIAILLMIESVDIAVGDPELESSAHPSEDVSLEASGPIQSTVGEPLSTTIHSQQVDQIRQSTEDEDEAEAIRKLQEFRAKKQRASESKAPSETHQVRNFGPAASHQVLKMSNYILNVKCSHLLIHQEQAARTAAQEFARAEAEAAEVCTPTFCRFDRVLSNCCLGGARFKAVLSNRPEGDDILLD